MNLSKKNIIAQREERRGRAQQLLHEQSLKQNWDLREAHEKSPKEMEELKRFQSSTFDTIARRRLPRGSEYYPWTHWQDTGITEWNQLHECFERSSRCWIQYAVDNPHVASQPVFFPPHPDPGGMLSRSIGMPEPQRWAAKHLGHAWKNRETFLQIQQRLLQHLIRKSLNPCMEFLIFQNTHHPTWWVKAKHHFRITDAGQDRQPEIESSLVGGDSSKNSGADQQRLQISDLHFDKFPTPATFACWKIIFKTEVCTCSHFLQKLCIGSRKWRWLIQWMIESLRHQYEVFQCQILKYLMRGLEGWWTQQRRNLSQQKRSQEMWTFPESETWSLQENPMLPAHQLARKVQQLKRQNDHTICACFQPQLIIWNQYSRSPGGSTDENTMTLWMIWTVNMPVWAYFWILLFKQQFILDKTMRRISIREESSLEQCGQFFNETGKLISEQTEITGVNTVNFKELTCAAKLIRSPTPKHSSSPTMCSAWEKWEMILLRPGRAKITWYTESNHFKIWMESTACRRSSNGKYSQESQRWAPREDSKSDERPTVWTWALQRQDHLLCQWTTTLHGEKKEIQTDVNTIHRQLRNMLENASRWQTRRILGLNFSGSGHPIFRASSVLLGEENWEAKDMARSPYTSTLAMKTSSCFSARWFLRISSVSTEP